MDLLHLAGIRKRFGPTVALDGVGFSLNAGEVHALIGENGAGKSTLMNILAGALQPDEGTMVLQGQPYRPASPHDASHRGVALIHQELSLCPHLTVAENILLGREPSRWGIFRRTEAERLALDVLASFSHPDLKPNRLVGTLPLAAQQVVEICRAIAARARIVLMDEPTSTLQRDDVAHLFTLIRRLRAEGLGIIYISHFLEEVREIADVFTVLRDGSSVAHGPIGSVTNADLVAHMVGRSVDQLFPSRGQAPGESVLEVKDLSAPPVVSQASFTLRRGEILGIAGLMGSGRTEMVRALFGLAPVASGTVRIAGVTAGPAETPSRRIAQRVGYLSEDRKGEGLAMPMSVADNLTMTGFSACASRGWLNLSQQRSATRRWIGNLGISPAGRTCPCGPVWREPAESGARTAAVPGRRRPAARRVTRASTSAQGADLTGHRPGRQQRQAVPMISSYLPELFGLCDLLAVMSRGRLSAVRPVSEWTCVYTRRLTPTGVNCPCAVLMPGAVRCVPWCGAGCFVRFRACSVHQIRAPAPGARHAAPGTDS
jgi:ribose transport system ATP-binding protein